jgi:hypothetical protein
MAEGRVSVIALCFHRHSALFTVRLISHDPQALVWEPWLAHPAGMPLSNLTEEELLEHLEVAPEVVALAQSSPGSWYSVPLARFLKPEEVAALEAETEEASSA